jgi:hypothetical protein
VKRLLAPIAVALLVPVAAAAQTPKPGGPARIEFRAFGEDGQTVADLKPGDVSLKLNGKPRTIQSLSIYHASAAAAAGGSALPAPYASNAAGAHGRIVYVLLDDDSISPGRESQVKDAVRMLATELSPNDRLGVLNTTGSINMTPSANVTKTRMAIDAFTGKAGRTETENDSKCRTKRLLAAAGTMLSLTGSTPTTIMIFSSGLTTPETKRVLIGSGTATGTSDLCPVEPEDFNNIGRLASVASVDLYLFHILDGLAIRTPALDSGFESLAGVTGAEFVRMPTDPQPAISRLLRETAAYYVATFEPEPGDRSGQPARVELKTAREHVKVRSRPAVLLAKETASKAPSPRDMLRTATQYRDLPLRATSHASRLAGSNDVRVMALFESAEAGTTIAAATVGLFDEKNTLKAQWTAQKDDLAKAPARADLQAPPGTYRVRVAALDASGRAGTADYELKAETVRADPLSLSTLVIGTQQAGGGFAPRLEFTNEPVAIGLLEIYGVPKGADVAVKLDVAASPDGPAFATAETQIGRGSGGDDARTAFGGFSIADLAPGDYLMRAVVLLDGKPVGRAVRTLRKAR